MMARVDAAWKRREKAEDIAKVDEGIYS